MKFTLVALIASVMCLSAASADYSDKYLDFYACFPVIVNKYADEFKIRPIWDEKYEQMLNIIDEAKECEKNADTNSLQTCRGKLYEASRAVYAEFKKDLIINTREYINLYVRVAIQMACGGEKDAN